MKGKDMATVPSPTFFEINVSYQGRHDHVVTVDRNGPYVTNLETARAVMRSMEAYYGEGYEFELTQVDTVVAQRKVSL